MNHRIFLVLLLGFPWSASQAAPRIIRASSFLHRSQSSSTPSINRGASYFVDSFALNKAISANGIMEITDFPGGAGDLITLDLKPSRSPIDSTTQFWIGSPSGARRFTPPLFLAFRGTVLNEPGSSVFLTTFAGKLLVTITRASDITYDFGPVKNSDERGAHILIPENSLFTYGPFHALNCITDDIPQPNALTPVAELLRDYRSGKIGARSEVSHSQLLQTDIAVEADSCFYQAAGGDTNTVLGYIASLFAMSSSIYEDEVNITWHLTWIKLWPNGDPYNVKGNAYALEDTVPIYWRAHYANVPRNLAHVMTSVSYGGGGYGYYSICDPQSSYSVSSPQTGHQYPTFAFTYDAYIVAHEIGHNFSLVHSHQCYWDPPLDTCYTNDDTTFGLKLGDACYGLPITPRRSAGTIMSYCANANYALSGNDFSQYKLAMTFSPKVDSVLRRNAELASCIQPPPDPTLILLSPRGSETFPADTIITVQWTYANLDSIRLEYSPNGGSFWTPISGSLSAMQGFYAWKIPNTTSSNMLVRAFDVANPAVADTSLLFFSVTPSSSITTAPASEDFQLSPNPAQNILILKGVTPGERIAYTIANVDGVDILSGTALENASPLRIDVSTLPIGTYYLRLASPVTRVFPFIHSK